MAELPPITEKPNETREPAAAGEWQGVQSGRRSVTDGGPIPVSTACESPRGDTPKSKCNNVITMNGVKRCPSAFVVVSASSETKDECADRRGLTASIWNTT